jgi:uncharacterized membrane protein
VTNARPGRHLHQPLSKALGIFVTGVLAALPLAATVLFAVWAGRLLLEWIGPSSLIGGALVSIGLGVGGSQVLSYVIGIGIVALGLFGLGLLVQSRLQFVLADALDALLPRIPVIGTVYDLIRRFVELLSKRDEEGLRSMSPVWCHFGGPGGAMVLGLLSTPEPLLFGERRYHGVLVPSAPVPVGGGLVYVPEDWVTPADVGVDGLTSIYVSMGVTSAKYIGTGAPAPRNAHRTP